MKLRQTIPRYSWRKIQAKRRALKIIRSILMRGKKCLGICTICALMSLLIAWESNSAIPSEVVVNEAAIETPTGQAMISRAGIAQVEPLVELLNDEPIKTVMPTEEDIALAYLSVEQEDLGREVTDVTSLRIQPTTTFDQTLHVGDQGYYYNPTEEEFKELLYVTFAEAGNQDFWGKVYVANAIINRAVLNDSNIIAVVNADGQFSSVINGVPSIPGKEGYIPVTEDMISDELREAVEAALQYDYTKDILKQVAEETGLDESFYQNGALYFYNPKAVSDYQLSVREGIQCQFQWGAHCFYSVWR